MMLIRSATMDDLSGLERLAVEAGSGMTTLPAKRGMLAEKIQNSMDSFAAQISEPGEEAYLFILEDSVTGRIAGCCGIIANVGLSRPFYSFQIINLAHSSQELRKYEPIRVLQMVNEYRGTTEIATLYLTPDYRKDRNGRLLSRCRFLFLAQFPERFSRLIMAEMRGLQDERGHSVFWDGLGRHFFDMDFSKADYLSSLGNYQFIIDLMPKFPIYIRLLPPEAQAVIGKTHEATRPALELLKREGFRFEGCIDVFDAGPTIHCPLEHIRTVRESQQVQVAEIRDHIDSPIYMLSTTHLQDFRVCRGNLQVLPRDGVVIDREAATALNLQVGDPLRYVTF